MNKEGKYSETLFRGLSASDWIYKDCDEDFEILTSAAFDFKDKNRADGYLEASITWNDDVTALEVIMNQRKDNENKDIQFKVGVAKLSLGAINRSMQPFIQSQLLNYERSVTEYNKYHGNLLFKKTKQKTPIYKMIQMHLCESMTEIIYRDKADVCTETQNN